MRIVLERLSAFALALVAVGALWMASSVLVQNTKAGETPVIHLLKSVAAR